MRILASISQHEHIDIYASLSKEMPTAEISCIGFMWSFGRTLRKYNINYIHMPLWCKLNSKEILDLPTVEFRRLGHFENKPSKSISRSASEFQAIIENEIIKNRPDIVIASNINLTSCFLLMNVAAKYKVPFLSLHASFARNAYLLNKNNKDWEKYIKNEAIPASQVDIVDSLEMRSKNPFPSQHEDKLSQSRICRMMEKIVRQLPYAARLESAETILSALFSKIYSPKWFPEIPEYNELLVEKGQFVLVALHQPLMIGPDALKWKDLLNFSIRCTPIDIPIVLRPHPTEIAPLKTDKDILRALKGRVVYISRYGSKTELPALLDNCLALITINSSTGLDAIIRGKPVYTLAPAYYSRPNHAEQVDLNNFAYVKECLTSKKLNYTNKEMARKFTSFLMESKILEHPSTSTSATKKFAKKIYDMLNASID